MNSLFSWISSYISHLYISHVLEVKPCHNSDYHFTRERERERYHLHVIYVSCIDLLIIASHALIFEIIRHVVRQKVKIPMLSEIKKWPKNWLCLLIVLYLANATCVSVMSLADRSHCMVKNPFTEKWWIFVLPPSFCFSFLDWH